MMTNYNHIAWIYDILAAIVFGKKIEIAKSFYLSHIPDKAKLLVVGGGTGSILDHLEKLNKQLIVDFVEPSAKMISRAKKRQQEGINVDFHKCSILNFDISGYDVILVNFFFDQFSLAQAQRILYHLKPKLWSNGFIIFSDFEQSNNIWDKLISRTMFCFFRLTTNLKVSSFLNYNHLFSTTGFCPDATTKVSSNIIVTTYSPSLPT